MTDTSDGTAVCLVDNTGSTSLRARVGGRANTPLREARGWLDCRSRDETADFLVVVDASACWSDLEDVGDRLVLVSYIDDAAAACYDSVSSDAFWAERVGVADCDRR